MYELLNRKQVAARLAISPRTLDKLRTQPDFPDAIRFGPQTLRWRADHIDTWIDSRSEPAARRRGGGRRSTAAELMA